MQEKNVLNLPEGSCQRCCHIPVHEDWGLLLQNITVCWHVKCAGFLVKQHFARLDLNTEEGQEYWMSMNLAGDYARACHERIHLNLAKALGLKPLANVNNHHNFAWKEEITPGRMAIVHRKGGYSGAKGTSGIDSRKYGHPGLSGVWQRGGRCVEFGFSWSRQGNVPPKRQKDSFTQSALKKLLSQAGVTLIGGSVEEMPLAYKDIDRVMYTQETLVEVQGKFMPRIVRMNKE